MKKCIPFFALFLSSCSLFGPRFSKTNFNFTAANKSYTFPIIVPEGYRLAKPANDSSGTGMLFEYGKPVFYIAYVIDTSLKTEFVEPSENMPLPHPMGGLIYKGMNKNGFWREIRRGHLRVGYRDVPPFLEGAFDSASNYASRIPVN